MDIGSVFFILALFVLTALFVGRPFFERSSPVVRDVDHELSALLAERDRVINALQELDFDHTLGKIPEASYLIQRRQLVARGAEVLRQLDGQQQEIAADGVSARLETAVMSEAKQPSSLGGDDELEALIADRRRTRQEKSSGFCPQCGGAVVQTDRFCPKCGHSLA
jgi:hypothetical protein